jgi:hypothetical protein
MVAMHGHFDGKVLVPEEHVDLPLNTRLLIHVEMEMAKGTSGATFLQLGGTIDADDLKLMSEAIEEGCERIDDGW